MRGEGSSERRQVEQEKTLGHIKQLVLLAGLSGAGKSSALATLEDLGSYAVDNLPVPLIPYFLEFTKSAPSRFAHLSLLLDIDSPEKVRDLLRFLDAAPELEGRLWIIFLDAATQHIIRRYSETRRPHPGFDAIRDKTLEDTIQRERTLLMPLKERAQVVIDTSSLTVHGLKREIINFHESLGDTSPTRLLVNFLSFGFKSGIPLDCDLVVDVRFLPNPHFVEGLREKNGRDPEVANFLKVLPDVTQFIERYAELLKFLLPRYAAEGKAYLNVGIGCTGGKHRSVYIAEELCTRLRPFSEEMGESVALSVKHRDLGLE